MVVCITMAVIQNELVPLLKTINEEVTVKDIRGTDMLYRDGKFKDALCRITTETVSFYIWENTTTFYLYNVINAMKHESTVFDKLYKLKEIVNNWIKTKS
jgi:hypothetical protein